MLPQPSPTSVKHLALILAALFSLGFLFVCLLWLKSTFQLLKRLIPVAQPRPRSFLFPPATGMEWWGHVRLSGALCFLCGVYLPQMLFSSPLSEKISPIKIHGHVFLTQYLPNEGWIYGRSRNTSEECSEK